MGTILDAHCEEYLFFNEYMQGNIFAGLMYDDLVEEEFSLDESCYVVFVEEVSDSLLFVSSLAPSHEPYCRLEDGLYFSDQFGPTVRAYQNALTVLHTCKVVPVDFCFMSVEVLHGVETFYEELWSEIHVVGYSVPANYVIEVVYESCEIIMEPYDLTRDVTVKYTLGVNDISNFRHDASQEYYFNCLAADDYGLFARMSFGYHMFLHSQWRTYSSAYNGIGKSAEDHIMLDDDRAEINWNGLCSASDTLMLFESLVMHRGYDILLESSLEHLETVDTFYYMVHFVDEVVSMLGAAIAPTERHQFIADVIRTACASALEAHYSESVGSEIIIDEDLGVAIIQYQSLADVVATSEEV